MAKPIKKQVNLNLKTGTNLYITRLAKKNDTTKAEVVEQAIKVYKASLIAA